jgi:hypothetical protein
LVKNFGDGFLRRTRKEGATDGKRRKRRESGKESENARARGSKRAAKRVES